MTDCNEYLELISLYVDGLLSEAECAALMEHLSACPSCAARLDDFRAMTKEMETMEIAPPPELHSAIMEAVHEEAKEPASLASDIFHRYAYVLKPMAAAVVLAVLLTSAFGNHNRLYLFGPPGQSYFSALLSHAKTSDSAFPAPAAAESPEPEAAEEEIPSYLYRTDSDSSSPNLTANASPSSTEILSDEKALLEGTAEEAAEENSVEAKEASAENPSENGFSSAGTEAEIKSANANSSASDKPSANASETPAEGSENIKGVVVLSRPGEEQVAEAGGSANDVAASSEAPFPYDRAFAFILTARCPEGVSQLPPYFDDFKQEDFPDLQLRCAFLHNLPELVDGACDAFSDAGFSELHMITEGAHCDAAQSVGLVLIDYSGK